jgi:hypothetical protein
MANEIVGGITNLQPGPLDELRGPYASVADACAAIPNVVIDGHNYREGKTADIGTVVKSDAYTWQGGFEDGNLLPVLGGYLKDKDFGSGDFVLADDLKNIGLILTRLGILKVNGLEAITIKLNGQYVSLADLIKSSDFTPVKTKTDSLTIDADGDFVIADNLKRIGLILTKLGVLKVSALETVNLKLNGVTVSLADFIKSSDLVPITQKTDNLSVADVDGEFMIADALKRVAVRLTKEGLFKVAKFQVSNTTISDADDYIFAVNDKLKNIGVAVTKEGQLIIKSINVQSINAQSINVSGAANIPALGLGAGKYPTSKWSGKRILWLGTSIPKFAGYPEAACVQNNATCINNAIGGSAMRISLPNGTVNNVYWQAFAYSLGHSFAEKQAIIDNWSTYYPLFQANGGQPAVLTQAQKDYIMSCSYENLLLPYLNGTQPAPDAIVIDHGYNDYASFQAEGSGAFSTIPATYNDRAYFLGAFNFISDLILQYKNRMPIIIGGHYENTGNPLIATAQTNIANYREFPIIKTWEKTRWSQRKIPGTAALWAQEPWLSKKGGSDTTQDMTARRFWLPDDLHPHTDTSNNAQNLLTDLWGNFLANTY